MVLDESALPTAYSMPLAHATMMVPSELMAGEE